MWYRNQHSGPDGGAYRYIDSIPTGKKHVPYLQIRTKGTSTSKFFTLPDDMVTTKKCIFMNKEFVDQIRS